MLSAQLREVAVWRTVAEVVRRCPGRMAIYETHGQAFVALGWQGAPVNEGVIRLQRTGDAFYQPFHVGPQMEQEWAGYLGQVAQADDPRSPVTNLCGRANLPVGNKLPAATPDVIVFRVIAAFLAHATFGRRQWRCHNGFWDTSEGGYVQDSYFAGVSPGVVESLGERHPDDLLGQPAYRFWFLLQDGNPRAAIQADGQLWDDEGDWWDLAGLYRQHQRLWPVIMTSLGHLLP